MHEGAHALRFRLGSGATSGVYGSGSTVTGLAIYNWRNGHAVDFEDSDSSQVLRCYLGVIADGTPSEIGNFSGVHSDNSSYLRIGNGDLDGNLISGNGVGVYLSNCTNCLIESNKIGTDKTGMTAVPNDGGIWLTSGTTSTQIVKNIISGNRSDGITIQESNTNNVLNNNIRENLIGTTADGMNSLPNFGSGISISNSNKNRKFQYDFRNWRSGIEISRDINSNLSADSNQIDGNKIGVGADGLKYLANRNGIIIHNSSKNKIGVSGANIISGNAERGIVIDTPEGADSAESKENEIFRNLIGLNANNQDLGNELEGVFLKGNVSKTVIAGNTISGNGASGILLGLRSNNNHIQVNKIGKFAGNKIGITVTQSSHNQIDNNEITGNEDVNLLLGNSVPVFSEGANQNTPSNENIYVEENKAYGNEIRNSKVGMAITEGARNNYISSNTTIENRNGPGYGIFLGTTKPEPNEDLLPSGNQITQNKIGIKEEFTEDFNSFFSIFPNKVGLVILQAKDNFIGNSDNVQTGNSIFANEKEGIILSGNKTKGNMVAYNRIGYGSDLPSNLPGNGGDGILVTGTGTNCIKNNTIGNNRGNGINAVGLSLQDGEENSLIISGNKIGAHSDSNNTYRYGNANAGIWLSNVQNARIGVEGDAKNVIANNGGDGILIEGENSKLNLIVNSIIGTTETGETMLGNMGNGIYINGGRENTIGGAQDELGFISNAGNFISGNNRNGILIENSRENNVYGNGIGIFTSQNGNVIRGNNQNGIKILNSHNTNIGGVDYGNIIGGNERSGIVLARQFNSIQPRQKQLHRHRLARDVFRE